MREITIPLTETKERQLEAIRRHYKPLNLYAEELTAEELLRQLVYETIRQEYNSLPEIEKERL